MWPDRKFKWKMLSAKLQNFLCFKTRKFSVSMCIRIKLTDFYLTFNWLFVFLTDHYRTKNKINHMHLTNTEGIPTPLTAVLSSLLWLHSPRRHKPRNCMIIAAKRRKILNSDPETLCNMHKNVFRRMKKSLIELN